MHALGSVIYVVESMYKAEEISIFINFYLPRD